MGGKIPAGLVFREIGPGVNSNFEGGLATNAAFGGRSFQFAEVGGILMARGGGIHRVFSRALHDRSEFFNNSTSVLFVYGFCLSMCTGNPNDRKHTEKFARNLG